MKNANKDQAKLAQANELNPLPAEGSAIVEPSTLPPGVSPAALRGTGLEIAEVEPWPEPVDGKALLAEIGRVLRRFVLLPKWAEEALALWVLHTYAFELRDVTTYLGIESPEKRCGKTTLLTVLSELVNRPVVAANISSPAFFRVIEETRPTLIIDEADTFLRGNDELRGILNAGYSRKTAYVVRVTNEVVQSPRSKVPGSSVAGEPPASLIQPPTSISRLARFSCWCPKVLAAIGRLPDTLADRCIVIRMQRKMTSEECERIKNLEVSRLRRQCARLVLDHAAQIAGARPEIPASLNDRAADIWEPLLALADVAGEEWAKRGRQAAVSLGASAQENNPIGSLLMDIWFLFARAQADKLFSRSLVEGLNAYGNRPWAEMIRVRTARAPQGVTELWLSQKLRPYGVRPTMMRIGDDLGRGYEHAEFDEVFRRYIPRAEVEPLKLELSVRRSPASATPSDGATAPQTRDRS